ncbi:MAG TPA: phenylalanine--tRNA ligase subunit alpha, partial [Puia sp.]|nr:phenylalanine--tRNA ligase subunit alpha [Puia sp.]
MDALLQQIESYKQEIESIKPNGPESLEAYRIKFLGTKGIVKNLFGEMKNVPAEKKKEFGQILNEFKQLAESKYETWKEATSIASKSSMENEVDLSLPGDPLPLGSHHPITLVRNEIVNIFGRLGFSVAEGPEIEDDWHNFNALNLPEDHPARDMQDTFYIHQNPDWLLRTHTSSVQARVMETQKPPIRIICPGRVYRNETISARAHCFFHQTEGL